MTNIKFIDKQDLEVIKSNIDYRNFYERELNCTFKPTGGCWHMTNSLCHFHRDSSAGSFCVNFNSGGFNCFSCKASGGDIISFLKQKYNFSFLEAVNYLKENY